MARAMLLHPNPSILIKGAMAAGHTSRFFLGKPSKPRPASPWARCVSISDMNVQKARSPSASRPWPPPAAARPGLMAPRSASMALQASAPGELRGALGRLGYLCAGGAKAMFVAAADHSMLLGPSTAPQTIRLLTAALSGWY